MRTPEGPFTPRNDRDFRLIHGEMDHSDSIIDRIPLGSPRIYQGEIERLQAEIQRLQTQPTTDEFQSLLELNLKKSELNAFRGLLNIANQRKAEGPHLSVVRNTE